MNRHVPGSFCSKCGVHIIAAPYQYQGKTYCPQCYAEVIAQVKKNDSGMDSLLTYVRNLYSTMELSGSVISCINKFLKDGMTTDEIISVLEYYYKAKGSAIGKPEDMWWVLRDYRLDAQRYKDKISSLAKEAAGKDFSTPPIVMTIKEPQPTAPKYDYDLEKMTYHRK
jgi:hypothetical protein